MAAWRESEPCGTAALAFVYKQKVRVRLHDVGEVGSARELIEYL